MGNNSHDIYRAIQAGDSEKVRSMINSEPVLALPDTKKMWSPFEFSIACGNLEIAKFLISKGNDVNRKNYLYGCTPLNIAAATANLEIAKLLITNGANINAISGGYGNCSIIGGAFGTPLQAAITTLGSDYSISNEQAASMFDLLIQHGADPNIKNQKGQLPYEVGVRMYKRDLLDPLYKKHGLSVPNVEYTFDEIDYFLSTLVTDDKARAIPAAKNMINNAQNISSMRGHFGDTLLHSAVISHQKDMVLLIINKGMDVNVTDKHGNAPLHNAIYKEEILSLLISKGANVNAVDKKGRTPLHLIAMQKHSRDQRLKVAQILIQNNAKPDIKDKIGKTAVEYITENNFGALITLLSARN